MGGDPGGGARPPPPPRICLGSNIFRICHQPFVTSRPPPCHALTLQEIAEHNNACALRDLGKGSNWRVLPPPPHVPIFTSYLITMIYRSQVN